MEYGLFGAPGLYVQAAIRSPQVSCRLPQQVTHPDPVAVSAEGVSAKAWASTAAAGKLDSNL